MPLMAVIVLWLACGTGRAEVFPFRIDQDHLGGAPDFSFLNHPLGPADRLFVRHGPILHTRVRDYGGALIG